MALFSPIAGQLPFGSGAPPADYSSAYQQALGQNKTNYQNILSGYQQVLASQQAGQAQTLRGYRNLQNATLADIAGVGRERALQIGEQAAQQRGGILSRLIGSGLGNSTMLANFTMAANRDEARARNDLAERMGQLRANTRLQTGLPAQGYRAEANQQNLGTSLAQLAFMNSTNAPFPDASVYAQLAQMNAKPEMNPFKIAMAAGGGNPQTSPGMLPSTAQARPTGGFGPQSPAFYAGGGGDVGMPTSGANIYSSSGGWMPSSGGVIAPKYGDTGGAISGYGFNYSGTQTPSYATSPQYGNIGGSYSGAAPGADYSGFAPQMAADYSAVPDYESIYASLGM